MLPPSSLIWLVTPCNIVVGYKRFRGPQCPHLQGEDGGSVQSLYGSRPPQ